MRSQARRPFLLLALPVLLVVAAAALFCARAWVYGFLRSDDFRHFLDRKASAALHADGGFTSADVAFLVASDYLERIHQALADGIYDGLREATTK